MISLHNWKLTLEYDGTRYSGWQEQQNARTVMGDLRRAAEEFLRVDVELQGAGRTDAGVHALAQVAHLRAPIRKTPEELLRGLNAYLPADIAILAVDPARKNFHARHDALTRTYLCQISTRKTAFAKRFVWWVKDELDVPAMQRAVSLLIGRHDFVCFRAADAARPGESTIVVVESAGVEVEGHLILFHIEASHFIWRMVRRLVGVLVKLGRGEITHAQFEHLLSGDCDGRLDVGAWTAPAAGLFLEKVTYGDKPAARPKPSRAPRDRRRG
ncbi:MAG TPA: tRNA pseudouridine(38-40) synthase TruA [Bryobacteraceae bacterium]|nr:tRNA pseudouridine(38-40) synthase TruA [Bryobacteraceae bacterium]